MGAPPPPAPAPLPEAARPLPPSRTRPPPPVRPPPPLPPARSAPRGWSGCGWRAAARRPFLETMNEKQSFGRKLVSLAATRLVFNTTPLGLPPPAPRAARALPPAGSRRRPHRSAGGALCRVLPCRPGPRRQPDSFPPGSAAVRARGSGATSTLKGWATAG